MVCVAAMRPEGTQSHRQVGLCVKAYSEGVGVFILLLS